MKRKIIKKANPNSLKTCRSFKPPIGFSIVNLKADNKPIIYITQDETLNQLKFNITNQTNKKIILKKQEAKFKMTFGRLLVNDELKSLKITTEGWDIKFIEEEQDKRWELMPVSDIEFNTGTTITFNLSNLTASNPPTSDNFTVCYENIGNLDDDRYMIKLFLQKPPREGLKELSVVYDWLDRGNNIVYTSADQKELIANKIAFFITNPSASPLVDKPFGPEKPCFKISFLTMNRPPESGASPDAGYDVLTYHDLAKDIYIKPIGNLKDNWEVAPGYGEENQRLIWELKPLNPEVLGPNASVEFSLENIRTVLPPYITTLYIQYTHIPGYNDGYVTLSIEKREPIPGILSFNADETNIKPNEKVNFSWQTFAVDTVELSYLDENEQKIIKSTRRKEIDLSQVNFSISPKQTTTYTLTAYARDQEKDQKQITITVQKLSVEFEIDPLEIHSGDKSTLSWNVRGSDRDYCLFCPGEIKKELNGTVDICPTIETTYSITGYLLNKTVSVQKKISILPPPPPPRIIKFEVIQWNPDPPNDVNNGKAHIAWELENVASGSLEGNTLQRLNLSNIEGRDMTKKGDIWVTLNSEGEYYTKPVNHYKLMCMGLDGKTTLIKWMRIGFYGSWICQLLE